MNAVESEDEGQILTTSTPRGPIDGRLRRAQALLANTPAGLNITRSLITDTLPGPTAIHTTLTGNDPPAAFGQAFETIRTANNRDDLRAAEAKAARAYWQTIADLPVAFAEKSKPVPEHWNTVGVRTAGTSETKTPTLAPTPPGTKNT